jgi:hypothetical protein
MTDEQVRAFAVEQAVKLICSGQAHGVTLNTILETIYKFVKDSK